MKNRYLLLSYVAGGVLFTLTLLAGLRSCNNYQINTPNLTSSSRATGLLEVRNKREYSKLRDGSEELVVVEGNKISRYQNFDGDGAIDRIRIDNSSSRYSFELENILVRGTDYASYKTEFDLADKVLLEERQRNSK